ncbi:MAG: DNA-binding response regulator [Chitinophagaceae bacterium]|jgi:DNA-binding NarL/FixJ family response regulator|nr:DNA-binding response regulator [Chitinophagia bacterium]NDB52544.1 DNA-binding response regulator [Chitinophagaceae bacterium]NDE78538.1 DNA-binding response regulator [Chitinophagaceae bacterium]HAL95465.1 DNA-binding response regulator [Chitinophagaceae bacterium]
MGKITLLLVDDHKLIRESWSIILNADPRFEVIGETNDVDQAVEFVKTRRPDLILMDINMSPINGFDATKIILREVPDALVVAISMHALPAYARRMFQMGAKGYVTKNSSKEEFVSAILEVKSGNKFICEEIKNIVAQQELEDGGGHPDMNSLSKREIEVVQLIKEGLSSKEIAKSLNISLKTVEVHRYNILRKLKLKNTASLVNFINAQGY